MKAGLNNPAGRQLLSLADLVNQLLVGVATFRIVQAEMQIGYQAEISSTMLMESPAEVMSKQVVLQIYPLVHELLLERGAM